MKDRKKEREREREREARKTFYQIVQISYRVFLHFSQNTAFHIFSNTTELLDVKCKFISISCYIRHFI